MFPEHILWRSPRTWLNIALILGLIALPVVAPMFDGSYYVSFVSRIMVYAIAAVSLNFILGYGGLVSLGHALFLLLGAYSVAILSFHGIESGWVHIAVAIVAAVIIGALTGAISLRTHGMAFIMITLAFGQMFYFLGVSLKQYGGDDGLTLNARSKFNLFEIESPAALYAFILVVLLAVLYASWRLVNSPFGMALRGGKSNARRLTAVGHPVQRYQFVAMIIAGCVCAVAGVLLANLTKFAAPAYGAWTVSGEIIFMIILGGTATIMGPVYGALLFLTLEELLPSLVEAVAPNYKSNWMLLLGLIVIVMTLLLKRGVYGSLPPATRSHEAHS